MNILKRFLILTKVNTENGIILFSKNTEIHIASGASINIKDGTFKIGYKLDHLDGYNYFPKTKIILHKNSKLNIYGDVLIGPGCSISVSENGTLDFMGNNVIAHNNLFICKKHIQIGRNSCISWNCQFMDSDGHHFYSEKGRFLEPIYRPLIIEENVGIQMNVVVPRGITIGKSAVVSCNAVLREDVPPNCLVIQQNQLKIKSGVMSPYGK